MLSNYFISIKRMTTSNFEISQLQLFYKTILKKQI